MSFNIPEKPDDTREEAIRDLIAAGQAEYEFATLTSTHGDHTAEFQVFADALKIEGVRVNVSAETEQIIADMLGCSLLTPKLADLIWLQRQVTLKPHPRGNTTGMSNTKAMIEHSAKLDADLANIGTTSGLICTVGKHWVIDNSIADGRLLQGFPVAMNYGWHFEGATFDGNAFEAAASAPTVRLIQGRGTRHNLKHTDYSQICVLVSLDCVVDGNPMKLSDLLLDPELAPLASHQGVLKCLRQPGVPEHGIIVSS